MGLSLLHQMRQQAGRIAYKSSIYNWSLKAEAPQTLLFKPSDPWMGDADLGRKITKGHFEQEGLEIMAHGHFWEQPKHAPFWHNYLHKFEWIRDLRALGGDDGRFAVRAYIQNWIACFNYWDEKTWTADILGKRLSMWLSSYDFYGDSADDAFQMDVLDSIVRQARHLYRLMPSYGHGVPALEALQGLIYAGLCLPGGERWLDYGLEAIAYEAEEQILRDGGHISRNPDQLLDAVMILSDVRAAIIAAQYPLPSAVQHALDRAIPALRFFRYSDKKFAVFNGAQENMRPELERVIIQSGMKGRITKSLPASGYERLGHGRCLMMIDAGNAPKYPYDAEVHVAPSSFELSIGRERVFVSCGTHPYDPDWSGVLRGTAAHNALTLDDRDAIEIHHNGHVHRKPKKVQVEREEMDGGEIVSVKHDGYVPMHGIVHQRRFFVDSSGTDIRGEDKLLTKAGVPPRPVRATVRFHLHPRVLVSTIRHGEEALLLLPSGAGWRFYHTGAELSVENSIYLGEGSYPRKTKQLVLTTLVDEPDQIIEWALQKESQ